MAVITSRPARPNVRKRIPHREAAPGSSEGGSRTARIRFKERDRFLAHWPGVELLPISSVMRVPPTLLRQTEVENLVGIAQRRPISPGGGDFEEEPMKLYFGDSAFDGQLQRSVGKADSGMANVGECLAIAEQITPGDRDSWYRAWSGFASRLVTQADKAAKGGHRVSSRGAYLRAAEYFR